MMADADDIPPLEDMSDLLKQVNAMREIKWKKETTTAAEDQEKVTKLETKTKEQACRSKLSNGVHATSQQNDTSLNQPNSGDNEAISSSTNTGFGGFKKGFLFGGSSKIQTTKYDDKSESQSNKDGTGDSKTQNQSNKTQSGIQNKKSEEKQKEEDIPFLQKKDTQDNLKLPEVFQTLINATDVLQKNTDWVTDDLMQKIEENKLLSRCLTDPRFAQAIADLKSNPAEAMTKYQNNAEVQRFLQEFIGVMGSHFTKLGEQQSKNTPSQPQRKISEIATRSTTDGADLKVRSSTDPNQATEEDIQQINRIVSNPEVREILQDPQIQKLFETLRQNPDQGQRILQAADMTLRQKIQRLVDAGLLQFRTG
ncbi:hypothetical protein CHS0354_010213 [Potamilus streckersoni]|uniref:STI1/HOP DP domain-containing protein n=1 Tax=Potamilus streckersoni TaxID=2493646 RepID=A0AAE0RSR0_9BIVA|nr:hypothetical protein CHS0354_010213 [Potamilus streckersoni]